MVGSPKHILENQQSDDTKDSILGDSGPGRWLWDENYCVDTSENGFDVGFEAGVPLGGSGKWNNIAQNLNSYRFWDGKKMATRAGCAA